MILDGEMAIMVVAQMQMLPPTRAAKDVLLHKMW